MKKRIEFYYGTQRDKHDLMIPRDKADDARLIIGRKASELFGGYTLLPARGGWINPNGRLVVEDSAVLVVITDHEDAYSLARVLRRIITKELNQAEVLVVLSTVEELEQ